MEASEGQASGRGPVRGQNSRAPFCRAFDGDQLVAFEGIREAPLSRQVAIEVARKVVVRDKDMRLAAEAPAERGMRTAAAGTRQ